jgi:capsular exopolysaccharide synthesis family protein
MQFLPSGPGDPNQGLVNQDLVPAESALFQETGRQAYVMMDPVQEDGGNQINPGRLLRKYWLVLVATMILGLTVGFISVVLTAPRYRGRLLLEVQSSNGNLTKIGSSESNDQNYEVTIETQVGILNSGSFLRKGADRMQSESPVALAPAGQGLFSRLRQRIRPATQDPLEAARLGLDVAMATFVARPVNKTRLIELTCESTSPDVAAQYLNAMAAEFSDDGSRSRMQTAQRTSEWIAAQIEETKSKVEEAEEHLRDFVQSSGNVFAGPAQDSTLEDTKLMQLKAELAKIQSERIARQTRYELTLHNPPESLGEVLDDGVLRGYQSQLEGLRRDKAALETVYTPKHEKVQKIDAQIASIQKSYENEIASVVHRIKNDYEASERQEKLLNAAYAGQAQRVGSEGGKAAQYNALKREVETQRTMYQNLLVQQNESSMSASVPVNPIRVVEAATTPDTPYAPRPILNLSFGTLFGLVLAGGLVFLRERMDSSIKTPGASRRLFNAPELGVIPNLGTNGNGLPKASWRGIGKAQPLNGTQEDPATALATWNSGPSFIAESFRGTLASILRNQASGKAQKMIMITSPGPAEGKTTVVQNLGIALAETGRRVLLVDADFRRPHLHREFSLTNEWGLIDLLLEDLPLSDYPPERLGSFTGLPGLSILPNRVTQANVSKALYSPRLRTILESLTKRYDMVLVDAPPLLSVADARIIAPLTDALILVLRSGVTNRESALEAYQRIQEDGLTLLGTVLTDYNLSGDRKRQYDYDYGNPGRP